MAVRSQTKAIIGKVQVEMHGITGGEDEYMVQEAADEVEKALRKNLPKAKTVKELKKVCRNALLNVLWQQIKQRPMVIVNILEV